MEMETGRKKIVKNEEPTSNSHSGLATKLLHLWSSGLLSAVLVRELADLAQVPGGLTLAMLIFKL